MTRATRSTTASDAPARPSQGPEAELGAANRRSIGNSCLRSVPQMSGDGAVADAVASLAGAGFEYAGHLAVVDGDGRLVGVVPAERLLEASGGTRISSLRAPVPSVRASTFEEAAVARVARSRSRVLAVTDESGRFLGLVPPEQLLHILGEEHAQDAARFGGYLHRSTLARTALEESMLRRLWHRTPWLLLGLLGAMGSTVLTALFETQLAATVAVAFFVPAVVYLADAVGTQTEALVIRGLSLGVALRRVALQEVATGIVIGLVMALVFWPFALVTGGDPMLGLAVSGSLLVGTTTATIVALGLPWLFSRRGKDPAFGSGPLATVIQDLLSIGIYLALVTGLTGG